MSVDSRRASLDFIGDIHGHADALKALLQRLGYREHQGHWSHPTATLVFLGDLIDRGPQQKAVVELVRTLVEDNMAVVLMGNHEFNAIGFAMERPDQPGTFIRSHTNNHIAQHQDFLDAFAHDRSDYQETLDWFLTCPLWFDNGQVRAVHACWHDPAMQTLSPWLTGDHRARNRQFILDSGVPGQPAWEAREVVLNGMETALPNAASFTDYGGMVRRNIRVNWWSEGQHTYQEAAVIDEAQRARIPALALHEPAPSYAGTLCFFGHYWMRGTPRITHPRAVCLDYSVVLMDGKLCAYRFQGEPDARDAHLVWVDRT